MLDFAFLRLFIDLFNLHMEGEVFGYRQVRVEGVALKNHRHVAIGGIEIANRPAVH
ncbi:Uncharacterised protein [Raoultella terrigena]|uniref:Uncharacterized protein n=1 Tax=Raoultella terrigena TaxID=577 RepID=A0A4U9CYG3_RAOTE|nr:Uncharacterised protein [Raoultella terrigena]